VKPVTLTTARLVLDLPTLDDVDLVTEYCRDPVFERFLSTPWPYQREDAVKFVGTIVPAHWAEDIEFTWAMRVDGAFAGMLGFRTRKRDIGFWLGAPHRGHGYMPEAVTAVLDWIFASSNRDVLWECYLGNSNSVAVARKTGFTFRGEGKALIPQRDGTYPTAWKGTISAADSRDPKPGWPEAFEV
jgi:RimJ/RimL family protein N-acetyltransferase